VDFEPWLIFTDVAGRDVEGRGWDREDRFGCDGIISGVVEIEGKESCLLGVSKTTWILTPVTMTPRQ
jgi:hypothetical protein